MYSPYCVWGSCDSSQYCCADNVCCDDADFNSLHLTITITGVIIGTIIVMALGFVCFYLIKRRAFAPRLKQYFRNRYISMSTHSESTSNIANSQEIVSGGSMI